MITLQEKQQSRPDPDLLSFGQKLAVEVGHLFRLFVNGNPRTGIMTTANNNAGGLVDRADITETAEVHRANDAMRNGGLHYGKDYVDDFRTRPPIVTPGRTANILGDLAPRVAAQPSAFDIYRLGARMVAAQRR